jgi:maleate isomerase
LHQQTYHALRSAILSGEFTAGERLVETQLAEKLQVSRTPIREAIRQLQRENLLMADQTGGLRVAQITVEGAAQLFDCRMALERLAVAGACSHATSEQLQQMDQVLTAAEQRVTDSLSSSDSAQLLELNSQFHRLIVESSGNVWLESLLEQALDKIALLRVQTLRSHFDVIEIHKEHRQIYDAIVRRDRFRADQAVLHHLTLSCKRALQVLQQHQQSSRPCRIGMLTPSSNTVLEPVTAAVVANLPNVSVHFGRFRVTEISLDQAALKQFDERPFIDAATLLADARVDVVVWNGTSAGWLGFDYDQHLCDRITDATGIPATSSVLALNEIIRLQAITRFGLVTPYLSDVQEKIIANYRHLGVECVAEEHLNRSVNFSFAEVDAAELERMIRAVAAEEPQAIVTFCTNLKAAPLVSRLEAELGIPIYDTVLTALWKSLSMAGIDVNQIQGWGSLFSINPGHQS